MSSKIKKIKVHTHCNDLGGKIWNPSIRWTNKYAVFVTLNDSAGNVGIGECWCFDTAPDALVAYLRTEVAPHFLDQALADVPVIARGLFEKATLTARHGMLASALAGIDIAMWDLTAGHENTPLWRSLNKQGSGAAHLYASGGLYGEGKSVDDLCKEMSSQTARGFALTKMKIGALSLQEDTARVKAVLAAIPKSTKLIIDGVYSYSYEDALRLFEALPAERIEAFQSPTKAWDYKGMAHLTKAGVPVMATEAEYRPEIHDRLIEDVGVAFLQTAPVAVGGLTQVATLASKVNGTQTRLSLEVSSTAIALMAAIHAAAAYVEVAHVEYHTVHTVFFDSLALERRKEEPFRMAPPNKPGLGISLPEHKVLMAFEETSNTSP
ncbi:racemase [Amylibacter marinus]|uniref:Racemase n=1 Tax=Amylibacter marinus TaxID=1475483 RepID=A0ABQ5VXM6_9RHOB|nr:enolase C-terminal domain-like protein [Amylibacter marinus]GLQ36185.1 racemase [Amylibacter marinus]